MQEREVMQCQQVIRKIEENITALENNEKLQKKVKRKYRFLHSCTWTRLEKPSKIIWVTAQPPWDAALQLKTEVEFFMTFTFQSQWINETSNDLKLHRKLNTLSKIRSKLEASSLPEAIEMMDDSLRNSLCILGY